jgi:hypothetical protein
MEDAEQTGNDLLETNDEQIAELYAPFVRDDAYGELGLAPQPFWYGCLHSPHTAFRVLTERPTRCRERVKLFLFAVFLVPLKSMGALACLMSFYIVVKLSVLLPLSVRADTVAFLGKLHCRGCLFSLGFVRIQWIVVPPADVSYTCQPLDSRQRPGGIISNHCSWIDILVHMTRFFPAFVARDKTTATPVIGPIR